MPSTAIEVSMNMIASNFDLTRKMYYMICFCSIAVLFCYDCFNMIYTGGKHRVSCIQSVLANGWPIFLYSNFEKRVVVILIL